MAYLGSWKIDDLLTFTVNTHTASTGAATDADAVPDYRVYEDETTTPILTGSMALFDSANTAGYYSEQITLSAANGFEKGKSYNIYITATVATVEGTLGHNFQMEAEVDANIVSDKTGYTLTSAANDDIGTALLDLANGVETSFTVRQTLRALGAALAGKVSGGPGSPVFRNMGDTADRITAVADTSGNRTTVTLTL